MLSVFIGKYLSVEDTNVNVMEFDIESFELDNLVNDFFRKVKGLERRDAFPGLLMKFDYLGVGIAFRLVLNYFLSCYRVRCSSQLSSIQKALLAVILKFHCNDLTVIPCELDF